MAAAALSGCAGSCNCIAVCLTWFGTLPPCDAPPVQMEEEGVPAAVIATLHGATEAGDWPLAAEAAWALELMGGMSRRLTSSIG